MSYGFYGKILKIIDWGRSTLTYLDKEFTNLCFSYDGEAYTQYFWPDPIKPCKPTKLPNIAMDLILFVHSMYTSQSEMPKDSLTQYINRLCDLPVIGNILTKHTTLTFDLYGDISKYGKNITPIQQIREPIFRNYLVNKHGINVTSPIYLLE